VSGSGGTWGSGGVRAAATWCGGGRQQPGAALGQSVQTWGQQQQRSSIEIFDCERGGEWPGVRDRIPPNLQRCVIWPS
jgi:hypothetical protein